MGGGHVSEVRVGIVSWNTASLLEACLEALPAALGELDAEVVVVDNASSDHSAEVASRFPGVTVIRNDANRGYAVAMNRALAGSDAPVLLALNPDTRPPPWSLARLVYELHTHPEAGLVVPRLVHEGGRVQHSVNRFPTVAVALVVSFLPRRWQRGALGRRWMLPAAPPPDRPSPVDWAIGAVHVIRAAALAGRRPYAQRWFMYVEDLELCWWLHRTGWQVWLQPHVVVPHVGNAAGAQAWGTTRSARYWAATYDFLALERGATRARALAAVNVVGAGWHLLRRLLGALLPGRPRPRRATLQELAGVMVAHARAVRDPGGDPAPPPHARGRG